MKTNPYRSSSQKGFTLVEMLVALAVSAIVIAGSIAGYTYFAQQYQVLNQRVSIDRDTLKVIDLIQTDIGMAGFKAYGVGTPAIIKAEVLQNINGLATVSDFKVTYDAYKDDGTPYRALIHYYLESYTSDLSGTERNVLKRDWRECTTPETGCLVGSSVSLYSAADGRGEPILDKVTEFEVLGLNPKTGDPDSTFLGVFQSVQTAITVEAATMVEGRDVLVSKDFKFITRVKNVSIVP